MNTNAIIAPQGGYARLGFTIEPALLNDGDLMIYTDLNTAWTEADSIRPKALNGANIRIAKQLFLSNANGQAFVDLERISYSLNQFMFLNPSDRANGIAIAFRASSILGSQLSMVDRSSLTSAPFIQTVECKYLFDCLI
jgi:hypothetical protein